MRKMSRRGFMGTCCAAAGAAMFAGGTRVCAAKGERRFHASISPDMVKANPEIFNICAKAGVHTAWLTGFLYGHWCYPLENTLELRKQAEAAGLETCMVNVPLGHPGDSLGAMDGNIPLSPPSEGWKLGVAFDGKQYSGTSLHSPATEQNCDALRKIAAAGFKQIFVDDDFRLARGPGVIGGCFCDEHKRRFMEKGGYDEGGWNTLLESVKNRDLTPVLNAWIEFTCDDLTGSFRAQQAAVPGVALGNMIMYMGAEKAGIRLTDYKDALFRVGELMFDDGSFSKVKGKTNELFSVLFHRRFAQPDLAFSETTAYPADKLSAKNMAAKLVISTIADVRNTMYMSGLTAFPASHWDTLGPAMKKQAEIHRKLAGHVPRGPFKHCWGEHGRKVSDDDPYSLFLAMGIPFEVTDGRIPSDGFTFLADADAKVLAKDKVAAPVVVRPGSGVKGEDIWVTAEELPALYELKNMILPALRDVPAVMEAKPAVCAWYPTAKTALVWNLSEQAETFTVLMGEADRQVRVEGLDVALLEGIEL